jgi:hypothetical protein
MHEESKMKKKFEALKDVTISFCYLLYTNFTSLFFSYKFFAFMPLTWPKVKES